MSILFQVLIIIVDFDNGNIFSAYNKHSQILQVITDIKKYLQYLRVFAILILILLRAYNQTNDRSILLWQI